MIKDITPNEMSQKPMIISTIITLLLGGIQFFFPDFIVNFLDYIVGIGVFVMGVISILWYLIQLKKNSTSMGLAYGIIMALLGSYFLMNKGFVLDVLSLVFGLYIIISGISGIYLSMYIRESGADKWIFPLIFSLIIILLGAIVLFDPFGATIVLVKYVGIFMMISAVLSFVSILFYKRLTKVADDEEMDEFEDIILK